ncbi:endolytic transglycosylase MltG [Gynuella sunshinyii]|uniref:Endolytic murein transglycosylase n=1 Tax=Gynuella sunshinyii YC6258 TaxID=1445510 RepID=A0A0C5VY71_9GAMM|nr:endolytic transglycosylase MltG [Gynuella sunshinyii]AJQ95324.1 putative periplasmic solute-binding protein [Gynuella sunshinyii YC6258]
MLKKVLLSFVALLITGSVFMAGAVIYFANELNLPIQLQQERVIQVARGSSLSKVIYQLAADDIVVHPRPLIFYARYNHLTNIKAGEFLVTPGMTNVELLHHFVSGEVINYRVTLVEGKTFKDYLSLLQAQDKLEHKTVGLTPEEVSKKIGLTQFYEGWFAPETYTYQHGMSDLDILQMAYERQQKLLAEAWAQKKDGIPVKSPYEALIMASLIEKETGAVHERPLISGVLSRRLQKGMRLQSDPTTIYGMGDRYKGNLRLKDLQEDNPYNTYRIKGLPPTPIANPGWDAILSAVQPADGKALYFVAKGDGTHQFSDTLVEHNEAVRKYQIFKRRKDYQSAPGQN